MILKSLIILIHLKLLSCSAYPFDLTLQLQIGTKSHSNHAV
ncbi:Uncharacterised protein [Vibrio cholerae]|nr:Uncharacterised protein [Vibrio cholerae]